MATYTVQATPQAVSNSNAGYLINGILSLQLAAGQQTATWVQQAAVVVQGAAVPVTCPGLPGWVALGQKLECAFAINYNQGGAATTLSGRFEEVASTGARATFDGPGVPVSFDRADASQAVGACAAVHQAFSTNGMLLDHVSGIAPSFSAQEPTTVCGAATWSFGVSIVPMHEVPCGPTQVSPLPTKPLAGLCHNDVPVATANGHACSMPQQQRIVVRPAVAATAGAAQLSWWGHCTSHALSCTVAM